MPPYQPGVPYSEAPVRSLVDPVNLRRPVGPPPVAHASRRPSRHRARSTGPALLRGLVVTAEGLDQPRRPGFRRRSRHLRRPQVLDRTGQEAQSYSPVRLPSQVGHGSWRGARWHSVGVQSRAPSEAGVELRQALDMPDSGHTGKIAQHHAGLPPHHHPFAAARPDRPRPQRGDQL